MSSETLLGSVFTAAAWFVLSSVPSHAVFITTGTPSGSGSYQFTIDLTFTVTTAGSFALLVLDERVPISDGAQDTATTAGGLTYSINSGLAQTTQRSTLIDNFDTAIGNSTPNDGVITFGNALAVSAGDTVKFSAQTKTVSAFSAGFNPAAFGTFGGNAFLSDNSGTRLTNIVSVGAVPEPASAGLLLGGLGMLLARRCHHA